MVDQIAGDSPQRHADLIKGLELERDQARALAASLQTRLENLNWFPACSPQDVNRPSTVVPDYIWNGVLADKAKLRKALVGLVGVDTKAELEQMEGVIRLTHAPDADKAGIINAIHALLETV